MQIIPIEFGGGYALVKNGEDFIHYYADYENKFISLNLPLMKRQARISLNMSRSNFKRLLILFSQTTVGQKVLKF